ncbi:hypothetical protein F4559_006659 [Saccharothrix violaceirubra]|uniref:Uncharacterized protein n=1 Tax=Saccharothrix violaceirubra TaxID=413306 RepID=A0A7W7TCM2_9PSEU|nr:hypothetical protein [Saccharothrix violaceirubra]
MAHRGIGRARAAHPDRDFQFDVDGRRDRHPRTASQRGEYLVDLRCRLVATTDHRLDCAVGLYESAVSLSAPSLDERRWQVTPELVDPAGRGSGGTTDGGEVGGEPLVGGRQADGELLGSLSDLGQSDFALDAVGIGCAGERRGQEVDRVGEQVSGLCQRGTDLLGLVQNGMQEGDHRAECGQPHRRSALVGEEGPPLARWESDHRPGRVLRVAHQDAGRRCGHLDTGGTSLTAVTAPLPSDFDAI